MCKSYIDIQLCFLYKSSTKKRILIFIPGFSGFSLSDIAIETAGAEKGYINAGGALTSPSTA
jgi:hypothetical protein